MIVLDLDMGIWPYTIIAQYEMRNLFCFYADTFCCYINYTKQQYVCENYFVVILGSNIIDGNDQWWAKTFRCIAKSFI